MSTDVFGTAALRARVLETWRASPARLREDANTEEDHARGYYRDRLVVELAQNAADAATRARVPGRLLLRLTTGPDGAVLLAANTGEPLDADGVASLASMRASAKRDPAPATAGGPGTPTAGPSVDVGTGSGLVAGVGRTDVSRAGGLVGRFGVGFAAVRAVADEVSVLSTTGGVRFSLAETARLLERAGQDVPALAQEVQRREGSLPALRLPHEAHGTPPGGYDTAVVLRLRDDAAVQEVRRQLADVGDPLLLALPGLVEVVLEDDDAERPVRRVADVGSRWRVVRAEGELDPALLADRPVEERAARAWRVTWALPAGPPRSPAAALLGAPADDAVRWEHVVHAPTPTDDPCTLPALLIVTVPLDPSRRHVAPGRLTDTVLDHAAEAYARLAQEVAVEGHDPLVLVPVGLAAGAVDGALLARVLERLSRTPLLRERGAAPGAASTGAAGEGPPDGRPGDGAPTGRAATAGLIEPGRAVALTADPGRDPGLVDALATWASGLVVLPPGGEAPARALGVELRDLAQVVEELPAAGGDTPERWRELYAALAPAAVDASVRESLAGLPVPLADGRVVRGARGLVLPAEPSADRGAPSPADTSTAAALRVLSRWGLRLVHPAAAHPVLERLGATVTDPRGLLTHPAVRQAVLDQADDDDLELADEVTAAVLRLVADAIGADPAGIADPADAADPAALPAGVRSWLGLLTLPAADGVATPAHGLVLPGSRAARLLDPRVLAPVSASAVDAWGPDVLVAAGVRADLVPVLVADVVADPETGDLDGTDPATLVAQSLDGWEDYLAELAQVLGRGAYVSEVAAVADLDAVDPDRWPEALARIAEVPGLRRALLDPVRAEGGGRTAPSYAVWWVRTRADLGLDRPFAVVGAAEVVARLLPPAPAAVTGLPPEVQRALGGVATLEEVEPSAWSELLRGLGPVGTSVDLTLAAALWQSWSELAAARAHRSEPTAPGALDGLDHLPALVAAGRVALVHADDAAVADAPMWWQRTDLAALVPAPQPPAAVAELLDLPLASDLGDGLVDDADDADVVATPDAVRVLLPSAPTSWVEHEVLRVDGVPVDWWVEGEGADAVVHATRLDALARGLAQAAGRWADRYLVELVLVDPARLDELAAERALDAPS
ncbi:hypothetical protein AGMMS50218_15890 [Actinomycetota bacterium]|nr:hypothetical protein AGMMS50218_15890 [Actinomycetota bacterium]